MTRKILPAVLPAVSPRAFDCFGAAGVVGAGVDARFSNGFAIFTAAGVAAAVDVPGAESAIKCSFASGIGITANFDQLVTDDVRRDRISREN